MASQLGRLKSTIDGISDSTKKTAVSLNGFDKTFSTHVNSVNSAIGGTTQRKDREVIAALDAAKKAVHQATQALAQASKVCSDYSKSL